jgi:hypothetical protein
MKLKINFKKVSIFFFIIVFSLQIFSNTNIKVKAAGTIYYVDAVNGNDGNNGTSTATAWKTSSKVGAGTYQPGDQILFKRGQTFFSPWVMAIYSNGTSSQYITIGAYGSGTAPILENNDTVNPFTGAISIEGTYVEIKDIKITTTTPSKITDTAIWLKGAHNKVTNVEISTVGTAISLYESDYVISNCYIHDLVMVVNDVAIDNDHGGTGIVALSASNIEIYGNTFERLMPVSIDYGHDGAAFEVYGTSQNINFYNNLVKEADTLTEFGSYEHTDTATNVNFHHNIIVNNNAIGTFHNDPAVGNFGMNISNVKIENNTLIRNFAQNGTFMIAFGSNPPANSFYLRNNIFDYQNMVNWSINPGGLVHKNNLYNLSGVNGQMYTLDSSEINGTPQFVDSSNGNYQLQSASPAINAGINLGYTNDYLGNSIPSGAAPDLGAYEFIQPAVSIVVNTDSNINWGTMALNSTKDSSASGVNDPQQILVNSGPADLLIKTSSFSDGTNQWTIAGTNGPSIAALGFSTNGTSWTQFTGSDTNFNLANNISTNGTVNLFLKLTMPTTTNSYSAYTNAVTLTAVAP